MRVLEQHACEYGRVGSVPAGRDVQRQSGVDLGIGEREHRHDRPYGRDDQLHDGRDLAGPRGQFVRRVGERVRGRVAGQCRDRHACEQREAGPNGAERVHCGSVTGRRVQRHVG